VRENWRINVRGARVAPSRGGDYQVSYNRIPSRDRGVGILEHKGSIIYSYRSYISEVMNVLKSRLLKKPTV
jgi:hypothetical protein